MFKKLKDKLKTWTKGITKKAKEVEESPGEILEEIEKVSKEEIPKLETEKTETITELVEEKEISPKEFEKLTREDVDEILKKELKKEKYQEPEKKFSIGLEKFEPDVEKLEKAKKKIQVGQDLDKTLKGDWPIEIPEEIKEEPKLKEIKTKEEREKEEEEKLRKKGFFKKIFSKFTKVKISEKDFDVYAEELELLLLENNVALEVAEKIIKELREEIVGKELLKKEVETEINDILKEILRKILIEPFDLIEKIKEKKSPYVILFCGINGTGKTTTIAKIAQQLKKNNLTCVLAAADTFRAASIEQIKEHGKRLGVEVIAHEYESDPASVGFDAIKYAEKKHLDCVLIDTAGRMHTAKNLMAQIEKISKVCKPDLKIFVGEAISGNDILEQVRSFDWAIGINGIVLTKADTDEKGGTALSVGYVTKKPILYLGIGQEMEDIKVFNKEEFITDLGLEEE